MSLKCTKYYNDINWVLSADGIAAENSNWVQSHGHIGLVFVNTDIIPMYFFEKHEMYVTQY